MKFYKNFLYGLMLVSCISGSIFAKGGSKSGDTTIILQTPYDGNSYSIDKKDITSGDRKHFPRDKNTINEYTFNPKSKDSQWFTLIVVDKKNEKDLNSPRKAEDFKDYAAWNWRFTDEGNIIREGLDGNRNTILYQEVNGIVTCDERKKMHCPK